MSRPKSATTAEACLRLGGENTIAEYAVGLVIYITKHLAKSTQVRYSVRDVLQMLSRVRNLDKRECSVSATYVSRSSIMTTRTTTMIDDLSFRPFHHLFHSTPWTITCRSWVITLNHLSLPRNCSGGLTCIRSRRADGFLLDPMLVGITLGQ